MLHKRFRKVTWVFRLRQKHFIIKECMMQLSLVCFCVFLPPTTDGGERNRLEFLLISQSQTVLYRLVQHLLTLVGAPARTVAMDDVFSGQTEAAGQHSWGMERRDGIKNGYAGSKPVHLDFLKLCPLPTVQLRYPALSEVKTQKLSSEGWDAKITLFLVENVCSKSPRALNDLAKAITLRWAGEITSPDSWRGET